MEYSCPECGKTFTRQEAYCENRRDPVKRFGCPGCHTLLKKRFTRQSRKYLLRQFLYMLIFMSLLQIAGRAWFVIEDPVIGVNALLALTAAVILGLLLEKQLKGDERWVRLEKLRK